MKRIVLKKATLLVMLPIFVFLLLNTRNKVEALTFFQVNAAANGFSVDETYLPFTPIDWIVENEIYMYREDKLEHYTKTVELNTIDSSLKAYAYKVISTPYQPGHYWGFFGIGGYGDDFTQDYVKTTIQFPAGYTILNHAPMNNPSSSTTTLSLGIGADGPNLSIDVDFNHNDLTIFSGTKTGTDKYEVIYDFDQNSNSAYVLNEVHSYGMLIFRKYGTASFNVNFEIKYHDKGGWEQELETITYESGC